MLSTIRTCTHEWSDIPSRSAITWAAYHQPLSWTSASAAARNRASLGLRSAGALIVMRATASAGGPSNGSGWTWGGSGALTPRSVDTPPAVSALGILPTGLLAARRVRGLARWVAL